jgi:hypothetical protein
MRPIEQRVIQILRDSPQPAMPLHRLHAELLDRSETPVGTAANLEARLRCRPDLFLVVGAPPALLDFDACPERVRLEYESALRRAGVAAEPLVVLVTDAPADPAWPTELPDPIETPLGEATTLHRLQASIADLCRALGSQPGVHADIAEALARGQELGRLLGACTPADDAAGR